MRARFFLAVVLLLAPWLAAGAPAAQPSGGAQPLDRLLPQIRRSVPGQFLDAEGATSGGNPHYHLKWLTPDGRVMWLDTDARTGRVLGRSPSRDEFDAPRYGNGAPADRGPDRSYEGRGSYQRYDRQPASRFGGQPYRQQPDADGARPYRERFEGGPYSPPGRQYAPYGNGRFGGREFGGGGFGGRPDRGFGNRGFGGGRDRGR